ncbi:MAG: polysaccharide biosynthesis tyrosine autokinase, partial [Phycisphaerae bacterium]
AVNVQQYGKQHRVCQAIQTRIDEVQKQLDAARDRLRNEGRLRMQENAQNMVKSAESREQDLRARRDQLDSELKDLDKWLVEYRGRSAQLESQQKLLEKYNEAVLVRRLSSSDDVTRVSRFSSAIAPEEKSFPQAKVFLPAGAILGIVLSFGLGYLLEMTNTKIRTPRDISRTMQLPLLGFVPDQVDDSFIDGQLATSIRTSPGSMIAESYRQIRGRLVAQANGQPLRTLLVASAAPGGGATTVASNLANGVALNGQRVLLIDANFYRPGLSQLYNNLPKPGLSDVISAKAKLLEVLVQSPDLPLLFLMSSGTLPAATASELLEGRVFKEMVEELKGRFDLVIFDGAPLNLVSDSISLAAKLDGVITVVRAGLITRGMVGRVRDQLRQVHARLLGIVLNAAQIRNAGYFRQNYRNFYEYATPSTTMPPRPAKVAPVN